ncbi:MAG: FAD-dependent oxidoreductase [Spirochaetota bacterium]
MKVKFLIIGSGPTGLGAAYRLKEKGIEDFLILEKSAVMGGLATSFIDSKGFTWDIGGHVQFSHYRYFDQLMEKALGKDGWFHHERESWVRMDGTFIPYPFQNNIKFLSKEKMWECLSGLIQIRDMLHSQTPENFKEWILATFGEGIAKHFMFPYNYKVWAYQVEKMAYQWIGERVAVVDLQRVAKNIIFDKEDVSWGPNHTFQFPKQGGTGAIWKSVAEMVGKEHIRLQADVIRVFPKEKKVLLTNEEEITYEYLLSTMPLDCFTAKIKGLAEDIVTKASGLLHSSSHIVGIGLTGEVPPELAKKCWMYFPENNCPFYRVTVFSNYSPENVPRDGTYWSLMTETSESVDKPVKREFLVEETIAGLLNVGLLQTRKNIVSKWTYTAEYGYPTPSLQRDEILSYVIPKLDALGLYSRGRFGGWKYEVSNQDHSLMQGVEWVNRIVDNIPEITYFYPAMANANYAKS